MDTFLKILIHVCLLAVSSGLQLSSSFNVKTPVDFNLDINPLTADLQNDYLFTGTKEVTSFPAISQCFCIPNNSNSQLVTEHLNPDEGIERLVVYLYKAGGIIKVFIPNLQKQLIIPDLNYDINEGDVLKPVLSNTVTKIFEDSAITIQQNPSVPGDTGVNGNDNTPLKPIDHNFNLDLISKPENDPDIIKITKDYDNKNKTFPFITRNEGDKEIDLAETSTEGDKEIDWTETSTENDKEIDLAETSNNIDSPNIPADQTSNDIYNYLEQIQESTSSDQTSNDINDEIISLIVTTPLTEVDESTETKDSSKVLTGNQSEDSGGKGIQILTHGEIKPIINLIKPTKPSGQQSANEINVEKNIYDSDRLQQILSILPTDAKVYLQSLISRLKNPYTEDVTGNNYITFDDWLKNQLTNVVIQNLDTTSDINALRNRIKEVFENNGMYLTKNGVLTDSLGNIRKLINIKLRPILIGDPVEYQNMLNYQSSQANPMVISYFQLILITQVNPPSILGLVPLGKVYLPRKLKRQPNIYFLSDPEFIPLRSAQAPGTRVCKSCKTPVLLRTPKPNMEPNFQQLPITGRKHPINKEIKKPENADDSNITPQLQNRVTDETGNDYLSNMIQKVSGMIGTPNMLGDQIHRFLGGVKTSVPKSETVDPDPDPDPDDDLGIRIIGGHPATSSGIPLVARGRSAFEIPRLIYNTL